MLPLVTMTPGKRLTLEEFKQAVEALQPGKIDLSKVTHYKNAHTKILCKCRVCQYEWPASPMHLMNRKSPTGCPGCAGKARTQEDFIKISQLKFPGKYSYTKLMFKNMSTPVTLIEVDTRHEFEVRPDIHLRDRSLGGCKECQRMEISKRMSYSHNEFIEKAREIHNSFYMYTPNSYMDSQTLIQISCPIHGEFSQAPVSHLRGNGCPKCGIERSRNTEFLTDEDIQAKFRECQKIHSNKYTYKRIFNVEGLLHIEAECPCHGIFTQRLCHHIGGSACQKCNQTYSRKQLQWLKFRIVSDPKIQHAENGGEFRIPCTKWTVDGYNPQTREVFEFQGDFWHGNPRRFNPREINPRNGISFEELHKKTLNKNEALINMGYTLIEIWESDWDRAIRAVVAVQQLFKGKV